MTVTLAIDASTALGTVALFREDVLLAEGEAAMRGGRDERLMPAVHEALGAAGVGVGGVDRVVCGAGPGGFTGLRIAASIAKGICAAREIPLFAASSLVSIVTAARPALPTGDYVAVLDALRGQWFAQRIGVGDDGAISQLSAPYLATAEQLRAELDRAGRAARVVSPGWDDAFRPHARGLPAALHASNGAVPVELATWEPDYGRLAEAQAKWEAAHGRPLAP